MNMVNQWLNAQKSQWHCDFLGIAIAGVSPEGQREIRWHYVAGNTSEAYQHIRLKKGRGIAGMVWKTGRVQKDQAIQAQADKLLEYPIARIEHLDSMLALPLELKGQVCGVLAMGYRSAHEFTPTQEANMTEKVAELVELLKEEGAFA